MRTALDFTPLFRSSIGFDRVADMLENANRLAPADSWPPYDIAKTGDDRYRICMAVAGFTLDDLNITHQPNLLIVAGEKSSGDEGGVQYLHRGIASRTFQRRFELADHVSVAGARLENGLLTIELKREIPEEAKPRRIEISADAALPGDNAKQIEADNQAA